MEQLSEIISMIGGGVSSIVLPLLGVLLFYDAKQRKAYAEARRAEADNITQYAAEWKELYENEHSDKSALNDKIDQLYQEKEQDRQRIRELQEKNTSLALENQALKIRECKVKGCQQRQPPSDY